MLGIEGQSPFRRRRDSLPLSATIVTDEPALDNRRALRRTLRLEVPARSDGEARAAVINDLSETGLQIETTADLEVGEALQVDLPHAGLTEALVVWKRGPLFGCEFVSPVSKAAVSAALLRSPAPQVVPRAPRPARIEPVEEWQDRSQLEGAVLVVSIIVALVVVLTFIAALLSLPFGSTAP